MIHERFLLRIQKSYKVLCIKSPTFDFFEWFIEQADRQQIIIQSDP